MAGRSSKKHKPAAFYFLAAFYFFPCPLRLPFLALTPSDTRAFSRCFVRFAPTLPRCSPLFRSRPLLATLGFSGVRFRLRDNSTNHIPVPVRRALILFLPPRDFSSLGARGSVDEVASASEGINAATGLRTSGGVGGTASVIGVACAVAVAAATTARFTR